MTSAEISSGSAGFARRERRTNPSALLLSLVITAALFGVLLLAPGVQDRVRSVSETLVVMSLVETPSDTAEPPVETPVDEPEVYADSPEEASPASRPRTMAPAPALPTNPPVLVDLAIEHRPEISTTGEGREIVVGGDSNGDLAQGPVGRGGEGGNGKDGDGSGGTVNGNGKGTMLIASWAPGMDFSQNYRFYPRQARLAGIQGVAWLECLVLPRDRVRDCKVVAEKPGGHGFGAAALRTQSGLRVRVHSQSGRRVYNKRVTIESYFVLPPSERGRADAGKASQSGNGAPSPG